MDFNQFSKDMLEAGYAFMKSLVPRAKEEFTIRISRIGTPICQQQYAKLGYTEDFSNETLGRFALGHIIEAYAVYKLKQDGFNIEQTQIPVVCTLPSGNQIPGTADAIIDGKVWDIKAVSGYAYTTKYTSFENILKTDSFGYVIQLYLYAHGLGIPAGGWIVFNKETAEYKTIPVPRVDNSYRNSAINQAEINIKKLEATNSIEDIVRQFPLVKETFNRKPTGKKTLGIECQYCPFKEVCWGEGLYYGENKKSAAKIKPMKWYYKEK